MSESHGAEGVEGEGCALGRERAKTAHWSDPGVVRMEIRPDRFKVVAAKTLGKIYGYVKNLSATNYDQKLLLVAPQRAAAFSC